MPRVVDKQKYVYSADNRKNGQLLKGNLNLGFMEMNMDVFKCEKQFKEINCDLYTV